MALRSLPPTNFAFLRQHDEQLVRLGMLAERYFADDPNTCLIKLRQYGEVLAQLVASSMGLYTSAEEAQYDLLHRLQDQGILPGETAQLFGEIRRAGNAASHELGGDHSTALNTLKLSWQLGLWYHRTFADPAYKSGPFIPPVAPRDGSEALRAELDRLAAALAASEATRAAATQRLTAVEGELRSAHDEQAFWEQMAVESGASQSCDGATSGRAAGDCQASPSARGCGIITAANQAALAIKLDEAETRQADRPRNCARPAGGRFRRRCAMATARDRNQAKTWRLPNGPP